MICFETLQDLKDFLDTVYSASEGVKNAQERMESIRLELDNIAYARPQTDDLGTTITHTPGDNFAKMLVCIIDRKDELLQQYLNEIIKSDEIRTTAEKMFLPLPASMRKLMQMRYLERAKWKEISIACHFDWESRSVFKAHKRALKKIFKGWKACGHTGTFKKVLY